MNLKEGTRRLALLLGVAGAILGGIASYAELQSALSQRTRHIRFERLANSDAAEQERKWLLRQVQAPPPTFQGPDGRTYQFPVGTDEAAAIAYFKKKGITGPSTVSQDPYALIAEPSQGTTESYPVTEFMALPQDRQLAMLRELARENQDRLLAVVKARREGGIKTIHWTKDNGVESIQTEDGQTIYPTPAPAMWTYLLLALGPVFGFFIPWALVRAVGWVRAGFIAGPG